MKIEVGFVLGVHKYQNVEFFFGSVKWVCKNLLETEKNLNFDKLLLDKYR